MERTDRGLGIGEKRVPLAAVVAVARAWRAAGETLALAAGIFDPLLAEHTRHLEEVGARAHRLVVAVLGDHSVLASGGAAILAENDRATLAAALRCVDRVVVFERETWGELLATLEPRVVSGGPGIAPIPAEHECGPAGLLERWPDSVDQAERALVDRVIARYARR